MSDAPTAHTFNVRPLLSDLPEEHPLTIEVNGRPLATLLCTAEGLEELAIGWAFVQGYLERADQLRRVTRYRERIALVVDDPLAGGRAWPELVMSGIDATLLRVPGDGIPRNRRRSAAAVEPVAAWRLGRPAFLDLAARVFARVRDDRGAEGLHQAAIAGIDGVCVVARDLSRHNAVDKVIGWMVREGLPPDRLALCLTGRISADIAFKAARARVPLLVSRTLPTADAVEIAHAAGITLVGRVLDPRRSVYSHPWRLVPDDGETAE